MIEIAIWIIGFLFFGLFLCGIGFALFLLFPAIVFILGDFQSGSGKLEKTTKEFLMLFLIPVLMCFVGYIGVVWAGFDVGKLVG